MRGSGCPFCVIVPRSKQEITLAFELLLFLNFSLDDHKISVNDKVLDVDIVLRDQKIVIEYDGSFWHKDKQANDKLKTEMLTTNGWKVIRVREKPLQPIFKEDVSFKFNDLKDAANKTLLRLVDLNILSAIKIEGYIERKGLLNSKACFEYIKRHLTDTKQG